MHGQPDQIGEIVTKKLKTGMMHVFDLLKRRLSTKGKKTARKALSVPLPNPQKPPLQRKLTAEEISEAELALKRIDVERKRLEEFLNSASEAHILRSISTDQNNNVIKRENIRMPRFTPKQAFILHNVLDDEECEQLVADIENSSDEHKKLNHEELHTTHSKALAERLWPALENEVPKTLMGNSLIGLSERCTLHKQSQGYSRKPRMDDAYEPIEGKEKSFLSVYIYVNDGFTGGETSFLKNWSPSAQDVKVPVKKGSILVYQHNLLHEIVPVTSGSKNVVRLAVMYNTEKRDILAELTD